MPNAVAFANRLHGVLGSGWESCLNKAWHCVPSGAISVTSDGGKTWTVARKTPRPVITATYAGHGDYDVQLDDGETLLGRGSHWEPTSPVWLRGLAVCPQGWSTATQSNVVDDTGSLVLCTGQPSAGSQAKAVYRLGADGWKRVAYTGMASRKGRGGISSYGYPLGIASNFAGFGLIWESRGTLYVTRDDGATWQDMPRVVRPETDFGFWAFVLPKGGVGWEVVGLQGTEKRRLIETTDAGRTWHVVHRWACTAKRQRCGDIAGKP